MNCTLADPTDSDPRDSHLAAHTHQTTFVSATSAAEALMANLTIRMDQPEKDRLMAWVAIRRSNATAYIKDLIAADMATGSPEERAAAWFRENEAALSAEAEHIEKRGVPGSHLALNHPWPDAEV